MFWFGPVQAQQFSGRLYKEAGRLGLEKAENYVELLVSTYVYHPSGVGVLWRRLWCLSIVIHHIVFCMKVLVIQVLSCSCVRLAVHLRVARWIHLFGVRFVYINELLAGLMFPIFRLRVSLTWLKDLSDPLDQVVHRERSGQTAFIGIYVQVLGLINGGSLHLVLYRNWTLMLLCRNLQRKGSNYSMPRS
jgi:hypothetical protein